MQITTRRRSVLALTQRRLAKFLKPQKNLELKVINMRHTPITHVSPQRSYKPADPRLRASVITIDQNPTRPKPGESRRLPVIVSFIPPGTTIPRAARNAFNLAQVSFVCL